MPRHRSDTTDVKTAFQHRHVEPWMSYRPSAPCANTRQTRAPISPNLKTPTVDGVLRALLRASRILRVAWQREYGGSRFPLSTASWQLVGGRPPLERRKHPKPARKLLLPNILELKTGQASEGVGRLAQTGEGGSTIWNPCSG